MSFTLTASPNSFIQIDEFDGAQPCSPAIPLCMPIKTPSDLQFQMIAKVSGADKDWFQQPTNPEDPEGNYWTIRAKLCLNCGGEGLGEENDPAEFIYPARWTKVVTDSTDVWAGNFSWNGGTAIWETLSKGDCFKLCFVKVEAIPGNLEEVADFDETVFFCTDACLQRIEDDCFTTLFTYRCLENSFGFYYNTLALSSAPWFNAIRLSAYLRDVQFPSEEKAYQKSDGAYIKLYERIDVDYELQVDWGPYLGHGRVKVLLAHDQVIVFNTNISSSAFPVVCRDKYEISWPAHPWQHAPAKTRVRRADALHLLNSNCG